MKIQEIKEITDLSGKTLNILSDHSNYEGYHIKTDLKEFFILINNSSSCCEFVGATVLNVKYIDNADFQDCELTKKQAGKYIDVFDCAFIDFKTDQGTLQFAVYNSHNGYYGHDIHVIERDIIK